MDTSSGISTNNEAKSVTANSPRHDEGLPPPADAVSTEHRDSGISLSLDSDIKESRAVELAKAESTKDAEQAPADPVSIQHRDSGLGSASNSEMEEIAAAEPVTVNATKDIEGFPLPASAVIVQDPDTNLDEVKVVNASRPGLQRNSSFELSLIEKLQKMSPDSDWETDLDWETDSNPHTSINSNSEELTVPGPTKVARKKSIGKLPLGKPAATPSFARCVVALPSGAVTVNGRKTLTELGMIYLGLKFLEIYHTNDQSRERSKDHKYTCTKTWSFICC